MRAFSVRGRQRRAERPDPGTPGDDAAAGAAALATARALIDQPRASGGAADDKSSRTIRAAVQRLPAANLALISVPGDFAIAEARKALALGLHVMIFSDNVPLADEAALKREAREQRLFVMGPDCGTAIIAGVPSASPTSFRAATSESSARRAPGSRRCPA